MKHLSLDERIDREARELAKQLLETNLAKHGLPLPKPSALEIHIDQLLATKPQITEIARQRVDAQQDAYTESLRALGVETAVGQVFDLDI